MKPSTHSSLTMGYSNFDWRLSVGVKLWVAFGLLALFYAESVQALPPRGRNPVHSAARLSATEERDLLFVLEQEKLVRDIYLTLSETFGEQVFCHIPKSEDLHLRIVQDLCKTHGVGFSVLETGAFRNSRLKQLFDTLVAFGQKSPNEALLAGALAEEAGIHALENVSRRASQEDIYAIYGSLKCGSMRCLKAFVSNYELLSGKSYSDPAVPRFGIPAVLGR